MPNEKKKYTYFTKALTCPDGSRKYIRGKTKKELEEKVRKAQAELDMGVNINADTSFGQLMQLWLDLYKRPRNTEQSMAVVVQSINAHLMPRLATMPVRDIRPAHIALVMSDASGLSRGVQSALLSYLRSVFAFAVDNQLLVRSPVPSSLKPTSAPSKEREPLTPAECARLLEITASGREWLHTYVLLCLYAGLRSGEACGLCWDCVDFEANTILVRRQVIILDGTPQLTEKLKTSASRRTIPAPPELMAYLRNLKSLSKTITVTHAPGGGLLRPTSASTCLSRVDIGAHVHPHLLRHTYATRLVEAGLDIKEVQYLLGHSTPAMTMKVYAHYDRKSRAETTAKRVASVSFTA